ncbi:DMT family transporter [Dongia sp.]|jgi:drug/metabolite transporter (DMT)-like permease|uniref:DMT family transporter n=1 Tax=Dongia sp. TaxID=1977262 RepID=UPI0035B32FBA
MAKWIGYFGLLLLALLWGTMVPTVAHLLQRWDPYFLAAFRYIGALPVMWAALILLEQRQPVAGSGGDWRVWPLGVIGIGCYATLYTIGVYHCHPVTAAILSATSPAVAAIVDRIVWKIPVDRRMLPAIALAIIGSALATIHFGPGDMFDFRGGEILMVTAFACWSWYSTAAQRWCRGWSQLRITTVTMTTGGVGLAVIFAVAALSGVAQFPPPSPESAKDILILAWMTIVLVALGVYLWNFGVKRTGVVVASLYLNLVPVVSISIFAIAGTPPSLMQIVGGVLVIAGIAMSELQMLKAKRTDPALDAAHLS